MDRPSTCHLGEQALKSHLFFSFLPSSLDAGRIMARYGPSTSKKMLFSERVT